MNFNFLLLRTLTSLLTFCSPTLFANTQRLTEAEALRMVERLYGTRVLADKYRNNGLLEKVQNPSTRQEALKQLIEDENFYEITLKNMAARMSVRSEEVSANLNDFIVTLIGITRDNLDARQMLTGNFYYKADPTKANAITIRDDEFRDIILSNNHYNDLNTNLYRLNLSSVLIKTTQKIQANNSRDPNSTPNLQPVPDPAGLLTTNTWAREHYSGGTNRRAVEYTLRSFLCTPIEKAADTAASDSRIGRDIDRFPGNDHNRFLTSCKGCHTVMDGFRGAFAKFNYLDFLIHGDALKSVRGMDAQGIANKMNVNNTTFEKGYITTNNTWVNHANRGLNSTQFGWRGPSDSGNTLHSFGQLVSNSARFSRCMARRVFVETCARHENPLEKVEQPVILELAQKFENAKYDLKALFIATTQIPQCERGVPNE